MTVPTSKEPKENMRHSSSWPERAVTVKVRVDPVSRAYTIIPTFSEDPIIDVTTTTKSEMSEPTQQNRQQERLPSSKKKKTDAFFDTKLLSRVSEGLLGGIGVINKKISEPSIALRNDEASNGSKGLLRGFVNFSANDSSSSRGLNGIEQPSNMERVFDSESCLQDVAQSIDQKNSRISRTLHLSLKTLGRSVSTVSKDPHLVKSTPNVKVSFDVTASESSKLSKKRDGQDKSAINGKLSSGPPTPELKRPINSNEVDKASHFVISACNIDNREMIKPPLIRIIDYDDVTATRNWRNKHACPKCRSDGFLELQVDPFRSPLDQGSTQHHPKTKKNCVESGTFPDRRFRSRSTTYDFRPDLGKAFGRRTKSFAGNLRDGMDPNESPTRTRPTIDHKKEMTLRRHYYPEGGWGYVVVTCSALVHFLGIGLQFAAPGSWHVTAERKFHHPALHSAGKQISNHG